MPSVSVISPLPPIASVAKGNYRPEIDGIRALAVVFVIINHFNKELLPGGYLGVDMFFVISGYVITSSLSQKASKSLIEFTGGFYKRRIRRLLPALALFVMATSIFLCLFNPEPGALLDLAINSLVGTSNISLYQSSTNYFAQSTQLNPFTHTWSLGVEEQFYLVFPFLLWFTGYAKKRKNGEKNLLFVIVPLAALSAIGFMVLYQANQSASYYLMPTRFWELATGCILYLGFQKRSSIEKRLERISPALAMALIVAVMSLPASHGLVATFLIVVLTSVLIACLKRGTSAYEVMTNHVVVYIGLMSYSLYLWHWTILYVSRMTVGIHWWTAPGQILLILLFGMGSYELVEKPFRAARSPRYKLISILAGFGLFSFSLLLPVYLKNQNPNHLFLGARAKLKKSGAQSLTSTYKIPAIPGTWAGDDCVLSSNGEVGSPLGIRNCTLGDFDRSSKRVLVIGNSFSAAFVEAFDELVKRDGYAVTLTSSWDASPVREIPNSSPWSKASDYYWDSVLPALFQQLGPGDIVFAINDLSTLLPEKSTAQSRLKLLQLEAGIKNLSRDLRRRGIRLYFMNALPFAREAECSPDMAIRQWYEPWENLSKCRIPGKAESRLRQSDLNRILHRLEEVGAVNVVDLFDVFCPGETCGYIGNDGSILYRDEWSHPSVEGVRLSAETIRSALTKSPGR